jgi:Cu-Zn family superoxide dismutase
MTRNRTRTMAVLAAVSVAGISVAARIGSASADAGALHATATLVDATGAQIGLAVLTEDATGTVHVNVHVAGLPTGEHGIHIHQFGTCTPTFADAGGHHNPLAAAHGHHAGDLPNLVVNVAGQGHLNATTDDATLSAGQLSVFDGDGSAVIIHADRDDFVTQPTGNSGGRIACGVIVAD